MRANDKIKPVNTPSNGCSRREGTRFGGRPFDIIGIGIGPFNLGLAALCHSLPELNCKFIDQNNTFNWHPGLMIPGTRLQVPFYADLVTLANPRSPFTYMIFINAMKRMFRFAILENNFIRRDEYNEYCRWVADQLPSLQFSARCDAITYDEDSGIYEVHTNKEKLYARHIVVGIGSVPYIPSFIKTQHPLLFHSSDYLYRKKNILRQKKITIVGSGQSAAEIFYDLLNSFDGKLDWFTRSDRFFPMDYSKFALEMTSPDYIDHFYSLPGKMKPLIISQQNDLFKGINQSLIEEIYALLYAKDSSCIHMHPNCELQSVQRRKKSFKLQFMHRELEKSFLHDTDALILATGYQPCDPYFLKPLKHHIGKIKRNYSVDENDTLFVQNAELQTHGFNAADLGMGPYRNAVIINTILKKEQFEMEKDICFQKFGLP